MDPALQETQGLRVAVEGCVSSGPFHIPSMSIYGRLMLVNRAMAHFMQSTRLWIKPVGLEAGTE
jgi:hypothetical protein